MFLVSCSFFAIVRTHVTRWQGAAEVVEYTSVKPPAVKSNTEKLKMGNVRSSDTGQGEPAAPRRALG